METNTNPTTPSDEMPVVTTVQGIDSTTVHVGQPGRFPGAIVMACNGRTMSFGLVSERPADEVTCKRCRKAITA